MALLGAAFQVGRSALAAYQSAIAVTGQNIANVGNPEYARQTGRLSSLVGGATLSGFAPGGGVRLSSLNRHIDEALENRLRASLATRTGAETIHQSLTQTEALYNEFTEFDLSTGLSDLLSAFSTLQTQPEDHSSRQLILTQAEHIVNEFERLRGGLLNQVSDLNESVTDAVRRADEITSEVAKLNKLIVIEESRPQGGASPLRDRRDSLLRELSEYMDVHVRETSNGSINVYVGSDPLVEFDRSRGLKVEINLVDGLEVMTVRFSDDNAPVPAREGRIAAVRDARDVHVRGQLDRLDELARGLIYEVNRVHSTGVGLSGYESILGTYDVVDPNAPLSTTQAGLPFPVQNGVMIVQVRDKASGQQISRQVPVDLDGIGGNDTTLTTLAAALDGVPGLSASVTPDNRLQLDAAAGSEVWFSEDTSGALAALGVGTFFAGIDGSTIQVNGAIRQNTDLIASSGSGARADGSKAGDIALLTQTASDLLNNRTIQEFQSDMFFEVAVKANSAFVTAESSDAVFSSLLAQREAISGVSLDEEAINLTKFERAFQGASRFISVVDQLTSDLIALAG